MVSFKIWNTNIMGNWQPASKENNAKIGFNEVWLADMFWHKKQILN